MRKEEVQLRVRSAEGSELTIKIEAAGKEQLGYVVWNQSSGRGFNTLSAAMNYVKEELGNYKINSIESKETEKYSFNTVVTKQ